MSFTIFQNEKTRFQAIKTRRSKSRKVDIFPQGLTHGFGPKMAFFQLLFFRQYRPGRCLLRYSGTKKTPFQAINTRGSKSRKIDIFLKGLTYGFGPKMAIFSTFLGEGIYANILSTSLFQAKQTREMSITIFQNEKTSFQAIKTRSSKSRKIDIFKTFFFLGNIGLENVFRDILEQKISFLGQKNKKFKKSKN